MTTATVEGNRIIDATPEQLEQWLAAGDTVCIDVREHFERAGEHIRGTAHVPLSRLDPEALRASHAGRRVVFHCLSGKRATEAAERYATDDACGFCLAGGLEGWKASGRPTVRPAGGPRIGVMRQVQMTAGGLVLAGVLLGAFVSPWLHVLSGLVGAGLMFAGASGWCGMAKLLAQMPWNRPKPACTGFTSC